MRQKKIKELGSANFKKKTFLLLAIIMLFMLPLEGSAQYAVNLQKAPLNPIPGERHTLNQFNLKGLVTSYNQDQLIVHFKDGRIDSVTSSFGNVNYHYDEKGFLNRVDMKNLVVTNIAITCDAQGRITEQNYEEDSSGALYSYNNEGLYTEQRDRKTKTVRFLYSYDEEGRLLQNTQYTSSGKPYDRSTYTYTTMGIPGLRVVDDYENFTDPDQNHKDTLIYNKRGHLASKNGKSTKLTYDKQGNILTKYDTKLKSMVKYDYTYRVRK